MAKTLEEELRKAFVDIGKSKSPNCVVLVQYVEAGQTRVAVGVPYSISKNEFEIGPYFKNIITSPPIDYDKRKMQIPIQSILKYRRIELSDASLMLIKSK